MLYWLVFKWLHGFKKTISDLLNICSIDSHKKDGFNYTTVSIAYIICVVSHKIEIY